LTRCFERSTCRISPRNSQRLSATRRRCIRAIPNLTKNEDGGTASTTTKVPHARNLCEQRAMPPRWMPTRTRAWNYLYRTVEIGDQAGATRSTSRRYVGYTAPTAESADLIRKLFGERARRRTKSSLATHCHNDLAGDRQNKPCRRRAAHARIECTINGLGERAGTRTGEVVMARRSATTSCRSRPRSTHQSAGISSPPRGCGVWLCRAVQQGHRRKNALCPQAHHQEAC